MLNKCAKFHGDIWEMLINQSEEVITDVGFDILAADWVEPYDFSVPRPLAIFRFCMLFSMRKVDLRNNRSFSMHLRTKGLHLKTLVRR